MEYSLSASRYAKMATRFLCVLLILVFSLTAGCANRGKPQYQVNQYLLDYPAPVIEPADPVDETLRLQRFAIAAAYNNTNMVFRSDGVSIDAFNYSRWAVNPADMTADMLLRDLRAGGLFAAVFSRYETDDGPFVIQGGLEEFYLRADPSGKKAVLGLNITLKDTRPGQTRHRIVFQKKYSREEALSQESPQGFAEAMSRAMLNLSEQIVRDVYKGAKSALNPAQVKR
jgi:ABC-type uncharacterized transport system auxiliary subunit